MKSASDNADKLITDYTRLRNNARQAEITQQISRDRRRRRRPLLDAIDHRK